MRRMRCKEARMTALPSFMYGNPADILDRIRGGSCEGCIHRFFIGSAPVCAHPQSKVKPGATLRRCQFFTKGKG